MKNKLNVRELIFSKNKIIYDYFLYFVYIEIDRDSKLKRFGEFFLKKDLDNINIIPTDRKYIRLSIENKEIVKLELDFQQYLNNTCFLSCFVLIWGRSINH